MRPCDTVPGRVECGGARPDSVAPAAPAFHVPKPLALSLLSPGIVTVMAKMGLHRGLPKMCYCLYMVWLQTIIAYLRQIRWPMIES